MSSTLGIVLACLAAVSWGGVDALRKVLALKLRAVPLAAALAAGKIPAFTIWALYAGPIEISRDYVLPGVVSTVAPLVAAILFVRALRVAPLSATVPLLSLTPVFSIITGSLVMNETPTPPQLIGVSIVTLGALLLQYSTPKDENRTSTISGMWMMCGVAILWAITTAFDKAALQYASVPTHALIQAVAIAIGLLLLTVALGQMSEFRQLNHNKATFITAVGLASLANALQLVAIKAILVSVLETLKRSIGLIMAVANGRLFFNEPMGQQKILAVLLMATGTTLLV